jgi:hypothetical protein
MVNSSLTQNNQLDREPPNTKAIRVRFRWLTDNRMSFLFLSPTMLLLLIIAIFPLIWSLRLSFTNWSVIADAGETPAPVGFDSYATALGLGESRTEKRVGIEVAERFAITGKFVLPVAYRVGSWFLPGNAAKPKIFWPWSGNDPYADSYDAYPSDCGPLLEIYAANRYWGNQLLHS